jgi:hypothetical protein
MPPSGIEVCHAGDVTLPAREEEASMERLQSLGSTWQAVFHLHSATADGPMVKAAMSADWAINRAGGLQEPRPAPGPHPAQVLSGGSSVHRTTAGDTARRRVMPRMSTPRPVMSASGVSCEVRRLKGARIPLHVLCSQAEAVTAALPSGRRSPAVAVSILRSVRCVSGACADVALASRRSTV